jgi:hypothetical protein
VYFDYFIFADIHSWRQGEKLKVIQPPKLTVEKPPSTPEMDAHEAEEMVNSMMLNSPLPNLERSDEKLTEEEGSVKLPKLGGSEKLPAKTPIGKLIMPLY